MGEIPHKVLGSRPPALVLLLLVSLLLYDLADIRAQAQYFPTPSLRVLQEFSTNAPTAASSPPQTSAPTLVPTALPTFAFTDKKRYSQNLVVRNNTFFTDAEHTALEDLFAGYTPSFAPANEVDFVTTESVYIAQKFTFESANSSVVIESTIDYSMEYTSTSVDVIGYTELFLLFVNENVDLVTSDMRQLGLNISQALETQVVQVETTGPTVTPMPSSLPPTVAVLEPTISMAPTPYQYPTLRPTGATFPPTPRPYSPPVDDRRVAVPVIAAVTVLAGVAVLVGLVCYYRRTQKGRIRQRIRRPRRRQPNSYQQQEHPHRYHQQRPHQGDLFVQVGKEDASNQGIAVISPSGSIISDGDKSLLSKGDSDLRSDSNDSMDETKNLQDEFDQYKDQNLEELRNNVEGNLSGFENIMSAAVTKALMGDEDAEMDPRELLWGCHGSPSGTEVEASALVEVTDWLKRHEDAPVDRKRAFMQEMLNKMVASVRFGILEADDASRTIHESAALLGLQLANELPMTTVIISGMRKTVEASELVKALQEFGDIDNAAVASGRRGFGIVRFRHPKSVERAMRRYRTAEIVIQDVAVQMKVLMPSGEILSRA
jgi:hypothetical protein